MRRGGQRLKENLVFFPPSFDFAPFGCSAQDVPHAALSGATNGSVVEARFLSPAFFGHSVQDVSTPHPSNAALRTYPTPRRGERSRSALSFASILRALRSGRFDAAPFERCAQDVLHAALSGATKGSVVEARFLSPAFFGRSVQGEKPFAIRHSLFGNSPFPLGAHRCASVDKNQGRVNSSPLRVIRRCAGRWVRLRGPDCATIRSAGGRFRWAPGERTPGCVEAVGPGALPP